MLAKMGRYDNLSGRKLNVLDGNNLGCLNYALVYIPIVVHATSIRM